MNNLDDMKSLWHTMATDELPSSKEMLKLIRKFRREKLRSKWLVIVGSVLLSCLMVTVMFMVHFKMTTTYLGGTLAVIANILLAATNLKSLKRFYHLDDQDNLKFLEFIVQTGKNQIRYYQTTMVVIISLSAGGWILYMYELLYHYSIWCIIIYFLMTIYLGILWFIVRPRNFKKDQEKLNATKKNIESILNQLK